MNAFYTNNYNNINLVSLIARSGDLIMLSLLLKYVLASFLQSVAAVKPGFFNGGGGQREIYKNSCFKMHMF